MSLPFLTLNKIKTAIIFLLLLSCVNFTFASETEGIIDTNYKYAWGENIGWINFLCDGCNVKVNDNNITGYAWSKNYGWINLNPSTSGVKNNGEGILSGYAWGKNIGWIDFNGVTIQNGYFLGYATLKNNNSKISFNCENGSSCDTTDFKLKTDWKPASLRNSHGSSGSTIRVIQKVPTPINNQINNVLDTLNNISNTINDIPKKIVDILKIKKPNLIDDIPQITKITPLALNAKWNLLPTNSINEFIFAPLPYEIRILASKFPELDRTLKSVGVTKMSDTNKLIGVNLQIPGIAEIEKTIKNIGLENIKEIDKLNGVAIDIPPLSDIDSKFVNNIGTGNIALIKGLPVANFPLIAKKNLPTEFVFARTSGELVDLNVALSVGEKGEVTQKISSLPNKTLKLVVKPISKAKNVTGYFVFKSSTPRVTKNKIFRESLVASAIFSQKDLIEKNPAPIETKLVVSSFEYEDKDKDGIYTADVVSPAVPGEYEIITIVEYIDKTLGTRQMKLVTVIDPEGYVFEKNGNKETRIPSAVVSIYSLNEKNNTYELWKAKDFQQINPQTTDVRGTYSFLVPEGTYYIEATAPGYKPYKGEIFTVVEGSGIHKNIEMNSNKNFLFKMEPQTIILIVVLLLLVYNFYCNTLRNKLFNLFSKHD